MTLTQMVFDAIITAQNHTGYQTQHFFGLYIQCTFLIGIGIQVPQTFHDQIAISQNHVIHAFAVLIEFCYKTHINSFGKDTMG
jgi:hypothetical protein